MRPLLAIACLLAAAAPAAAGYRPSPGWPAVRLEFYHAGAAIDVERRLAHWRARGCDLRLVGFTGSMRPVLHGGEWLAAEPYHAGTPITPGTVVIFRRWDGIAPVHYVAAINSRHREALITGLANRRSDGWYPFSAITHVVREAIAYDGPRAER